MRHEGRIGSGLFKIRQLKSKIAFKKASTEQKTLVGTTVDGAVVVASLVSGHFVTYEHPAEYHGNH